MFSMTFDPEMLFLLTMGMFGGASLLIATASVIVASKQNHYQPGDDYGTSQIDD